MEASARSQGRRALNSTDESLTEPPPRRDVEDEESADLDIRV
jgi:hypothetical protein